MNAERKKRISKIAEGLGRLGYFIDEIKEEEQKNYDDFLESGRSSERGEKLKDNISLLRTALYYVSDAISSLEEID